MIEIAKTQVLEMTKGNFNNVVQSFSEDVAKQLDEQTMKLTWDATVAPIGKYIGFYEATGEPVGKYFTVSIIEQYELNALKVTITYNTDNKIVGLNLNYFTIDKPLVSTEKFEEIDFIIGEKFPLSGILTLPKGVINPPVVLLIQGSGATDKNSTIYSNMPFKDIAYGLAEQGIATLRYDKRYYAYPEQAQQLSIELTLNDEVLEDAQLALELLSNEPKIDTSNIYVLGHSLGGGLTPYLAYQNDNVKGIISMAGTLRPLYELSYDQNKDIEAIILNGNFDDATVNMVKTQMEQVEKDIQILRSTLSDVPNEQILIGLPAGYQKSVKNYAGENFINDIAVLILILQGTADFQVYADKDYKLWQSTLKNRNNVDFKLYEGLNHLMMTTNGKQDISEYEIKGSVSQDVIDDIATFVKKHYSEPTDV
ncbi:hypothetical protein AN396_04110 [Candidatus Epulonipiscium fishelsonii]|uniref:Uncharacterized protein n=1 Tax=Candidatus Epulonipiscium fishelsonii TaxID=77094 RepID=A0ACC8XDL7_9FIRM|nr:hypothetical protein AN396_04110 [Epulopiscium sp. SCG-B11WGA-EpuloA1]